MNKKIVKETAPGEFVELPWGARIQHDGVLHNWIITERWTDADLAAIDLYRVDPATVPAGHRELSRHFERQGGAVVEVIESEPLPLVVTPRQIRLALTEMGLRQAVEDYVAAQDQTVKDSWEFSTQFERNHPLIIAAAQALDKTEAEVDALFALAATK